jgi:hypothetical protein
MANAPQVNERGTGGESLVWVLRTYRGPARRAQPWALLVGGGTGMGLDGLGQIESAVLDLGRKRLPGGRAED